ncbi:alpha/beta hydrolase [Photobacterium chitinilyticum]|uniref:Alpha/beta hydrolase n=1 Tax=Photobacterium chitinilyticum TaxID=2485123 RepID=A0A444JRV3_9GAMM|nr:alpha/beta hydrolase [Photobacterium chitinilyticum]RWX55708.1 alpha/beta hydrolase [Photobacterium chitinilyticum]
MSSKIYFKQGKGLDLRRGLINLTTRLHHTVAPRHARKVAKNLLLTPDRGKRCTREPVGLIRRQIETTEGKIMTYQLGLGPTWILGHGWSGSSSQFYSLMEHIAAAGYTALAFDNPAHGESEGRYGHLPGFVKVFDEVLDQQASIVGVIAHSMGGAMVLESRHSLLKGKPILLVAPVLNYTENLVSTVKRSGYSMKLFNEVVGEISETYQYSLESIDPLERLKTHFGETVIVHDKGDRFASFQHSETACNLDHVKLLATEGLGHGRILNSAPLRQAFDSLVAQQ